jgi:hypothetical protein
VRLVTQAAEEPERSDRHVVIINRNEGDQMTSILNTTSKSFRIKFLAVLILVASAFSIQAAQSEAARYMTGDLKFSYNARLGGTAPLSGAKVTFWKSGNPTATKTTDSNGIVTVSGLRGTTFSLTISKTLGGCIGAGIPTWIKPFTWKSTGSWSVPTGGASRQTFSTLTSYTDVCR